MSYLKKCKKKNLINPQDFVTSQLQYEVIMGSNAYGVSSENSDMDIYGFCIPNKNIVFMDNHIRNFDTINKVFEQYQQHHISDISCDQEFDFSIYNITKYFRLCANGNPNMIDSLFVPRRCITHSTPIGELVREHRRIFLSKKCWHTFKGYAYSQIHKMNIKIAAPESRRYESVIKYGYDIKFAYHIVRLLNEIEQILTEHDLDLERNREQIKSIRRGEWKKEDIISYFEEKEKQLEKLHTQSTLPHKIREEEIRALLIVCLKKHFGDIKELNINLTLSILDDIENILYKYR